MYYVKKMNTMKKWWMVAVALGVFLLGGGLTVMIAKPFRKKLEEEESEEEPV